MSDSTEDVRKQQAAEINDQPGNIFVLKEKYGRVWNTYQLTKEFTIIGFMAPYVAVKRKSDGVVGSMMFQHLPRFYFNFVKDSE